MIAVINFLHTCPAASSSILLQQHPVHHVPAGPSPPLSHAFSAVCCIGVRLSVLVGRIPLFRIAAEQKLPMVGGVVDRRGGSSSGRRAC